MRKYSVVIPAFNAAETILDSLASLEMQTLRPSEVIIINDGSSDNTLEVILDYQINSELPIKVINNLENMGICRSLNEGILKSTYDWIARMDADDICRPDRFKKQFDYIREHKLSVCGSFIQLFDDKRKLAVITYPETNIGIRHSLLFSCPFAHPTVVFDKRIKKPLQYDPKFEGVEDWALWIDLAADSTILFGNVPEILLEYRVTETQYSRRVSNNVREQLIIQLKQKMYMILLKKYNFANSKEVLKFLKQTKAEIREQLPLKRLKYFALRLDNNFNVTTWDKIRVVWFSGILRFFYEKLKKL